MDPIFSVGQKVICINDAFPRAIVDWCDSLPVADHVYTIRAMQIGRDSFTGCSNLGLLLAEIVNPTSSLGCEAGFCHYRFEPHLKACSESEYDDAVRQTQLKICVSPNLVLVTQKS